MRNGTLQNMLIKHQNMFFGILAAIMTFMIYIISGIIIPNANASFKFIKNIVSLYKTLPSTYFHDQSNDYNDQILEICENYDVQDEGVGRKSTKNKNSSTKQVKYSFLVYCLIVTVCLLVPLLTVFIYKSKSQELINYMVNSNMRSYLMGSINLFAIEHILQDRYYYSKGEPMRLLTDTYEKLKNLESELKNGVYGDRTSPHFSIFDYIDNTPDCYRSTYLKHECDEIKYNEFYTKELSSSSIDYLMVEYLNKVNEFITLAPEKHYDLKNATDLNNALEYIMNDPYLQGIKYLSYDIIGHIDTMNEVGTQHITDIIEEYEIYTLYFHILGSLIIFITFFIFVSRPIKKQLRLIDVLTNITFAIPSSIYNSSPKMKK
eukprot:jgi/Orpsp1_1/1178045/evm.model.c7180000063836.1